VDHWQRPRRRRRARYPMASAASAIVPMCAPTRPPELSTQTTTKNWVEHAVGLVVQIYAIFFTTSTRREKNSRNSPFWSKPVDGHRSAEGAMPPDHRPNKEGSTWRATGSGESWAGGTPPLAHSGDASPNQPASGRRNQPASGRQHLCPSY